MNCIHNVSAGTIYVLYRHRVKVTMMDGPMSNSVPTSHCFGDVTSQAKSHLYFHKSFSKERVYTDRHISDLDTHRSFGLITFHSYSGVSVSVNGRTSLMISRKVRHWLFLIKYQYTPSHMNDTLKHKL